MKKKTSVKTLIRQIVREEVAIAIKEVITELKQPSNNIKPIPQRRQVTKAIGKEVNFSSNPIINEVLSQTEGGLPQNAQEEYPTMGGGTYDSSKMGEVVASQYGQMMNNNPGRGVSNSDIIAPEQSNEVKNMFDKDFSGILKASINKSKGKRR